MGFWAVYLSSNTCIVSKPLEISGALCGTAIVPDGSHAAGVELRVTDHQGTKIADVRTDGKGDFTFSSLAKGKYQLTTTAVGFKSYIGEFQIRGNNTAKCKRPVVVKLGIISCQAGISRRRAGVSGLVGNTTRH
jgi:hypothetical protein